jgi:predicted porin
MKKSLIALAALAAVSAASAQSTVTISGGMALGVGMTKFGTNDSGLQIVRQTGNFQFAGTEDLGGGLKAGFQVQTSIGGVATTNETVSNSTAGDNNFVNKRTILGDRAANLNVSGNFGTVLVGRNSTAIRSLFGAMGDVSLLAVPSGLSTGSSAASAAVDGGLINAGSDANARVIYGDTFSNQVSYVSPAISGFTVAIGVAPGQTVSTGLGNDAANKDAVSYSLQYAQGPIAAAVNLTDTAKTGGNKITTVLGSYDLGVAKVGLTHQTIKMQTGVNPGAGTSFTVSVPVGPGNIGFGYGKRSAAVQASASFGDNVKQTFVGYRYNLSKRTNVQAVYNKIDRTGTTTDVKETHLIVAHTF